MRKLYDIILTAVKKSIVELARKSASIEANSACPLINYQPVETEKIRQLCKF